MRLCLPSYLAQRELDVGKLLPERLIHVFLQVGRLHVLHHGGLQRNKETSLRQQQQRLCSSHSSTLFIASHSLRSCDAVDWLQIASCEQDRMEVVLHCQAALQLSFFFFF